MVEVIYHMRDGSLATPEVVEAFKKELAELHAFHRAEEERMVLERERLYAKKLFAPNEFTEADAKTIEFFGRMLMDNVSQDFDTDSLCIKFFGSC